MYALTVANGGIKLQPMEEGGCIPRDLAKGVFVSEMFPPGQKPLCITHTGWDGPNWTIDAAGQPLRNISSTLGGLILDWPVLDKTGVAGVFTFHLKFAHDETTPGVLPASMNPFPTGPSDVPLAPSLKTVLEQQLGLLLIPDKGPRESIFVDSAQRPSLN